MPTLSNPKDRIKLYDWISIFTEDNKINWQKIDSISSEIFKACLDFIYTND